MNNFSSNNYSPNNNYNNMQSNNYFNSNINQNNQNEVFSIAQNELNNNNFSYNKNIDTNNRNNKKEEDSSNNYINHKKENNSEGSLSQTEKINNYNDVSEDSIQAQKIINEDSSHLNPFQKHLESVPFVKKEEKKKKIEDKNFKSQENLNLLNIQNNKENKSNSIKKESIENLEKEQNKENKQNNFIKNQMIENFKDEEMNINNTDKNSIKSNENNKEKNKNIRNKYYTEIVNSNILSNGDNAFNSFSKTSSIKMNHHANIIQMNNDYNNKNIKKVNIHNKNNNLNQKDQNYLSFTLKNININKSNNLDLDHNSIQKDKNEEIKNIKYINISQDHNLNLSEKKNENNNKINEIPLENLDKNRDEFKEFLIVENNNLKKELKNYEELIKPLINYINNVNKRLGQKEINPRDIRTIIKSDNPSLYINNLERNLINSNNDIFIRIEKMKEKINSMKNKNNNHLNNSQKIYKSNSLNNRINNIRIIKNNKSDDEDERNFSKTHYEKGNFFYEDLSDKYFYDYYKNRIINCPACIIGNSNSERGFSPIICCHLNDKSEENNSNSKIENDISNKIKN